MKTCLAAILIGSFCLPGQAETNGFDAAGASFETLVLHAQRYGSTQEKKDRRKKARAEMASRGCEALHYLMQNMHIENDSILMLVSHLVGHEKIEDFAAAEVLLEYLESEEARTRRMAAYFLWYCETPEYAEQLLPLLDDPKAAGAALRTLGKWKANAAAGRAAAFLDHDNERRRVLASFALRNMEAVQHAPDLVAALNDPYFTVRKSAAKTLSSFGASIEPLILRELDVSRGLARRELIRVLGEIGAKKSRARLRTLRDDPEPAVREDAQRALQKISLRQS